MLGGEDAWRRRATAALVGAWIGGSGACSQASPLAPQSDASEAESASPAPVAAPVDSGRTPLPALARPPRPLRPVRPAPVELCALPPVLGSGSLPCDALLPIVGEGHVTAWGRTGLTQRQRAALGTAPLPEGTFEGLTGRLAAAPTGVVELTGAEDGTQHALVGLVAMTAPRRVRVGLGVVGHAEVFVGGARVLDLNGTTPLIDDATTAIDLPAGVTPLVVMVRAGKQTPKVALRLSGDDWQPLDEAWFAPLVRKGARDDLVPTPAPLDVEWAVHPVVSGFDVTAAVRARGLVPAGGAPLSLDAGGSPATRAASAEELARGVALSLSLRPNGKRPTQHKPALATITLKAADAAARARVVAYRGDLHDELAKLAQELDRTAPSAALASAHLSVRAPLGEVLSALPNEKLDVAWASERAKALGELGAAVLAGRDPFPSTSGVVWRAYRSPLDGKPQVYVLFVPPSLTKAGAGKKVPLVLSMHGLHHRAEHAMRIVIGESPKKNMELGWAARHLPRFPDQGALIAAPFGFGDAGQRPLGEDDVLRVIDDVSARYPIDERKVSITGYSMGGTVSFFLPLHYPDRFAASAPLCASANLVTYQSITTVPHAPWEEALIASRYIGHYAENALHLPFFVVHGGLDGPARSQILVNRLRAVGGRVDFDMQPDLDHNVWDHAYEDGGMIPKLRAFSRPAAPARVRFTTGDYRWNSSYWVRLHELSPALFEPSTDLAPEWKQKRFAEVDATWDAAAHTIRLSTKNARVVELDVPRLAASRPVTIVVDGVDIGTSPADQRAVVQTSPAKLLGAAPSRAGKKRHGLAGPLDDVIRHPLLFVVGTLDPGFRPSLERLAKHFAEEDSYAARYPIKNDVEVTTDELARYSLVLLGGPRENALAARIAERLPVRFDERGLTVRGVRYEGPEVATSFLAQSPFAPDEYVVVHAGMSPASTLRARNLPRLAPDFLVYDQRLTPSPGALLVGNRAVLTAGFWSDGFE
jgi:hypothetical protein